MMSGWPDWHIESQCTPTLLVSGYDIMSLFTMINTQLEILKKRSVEQDMRLNEANQREIMNNEKNSRLINKLNERIDRLQKQLDASESGQMEDKLRKTEERVKQLENILAQYSLSDYKHLIDNNKNSILENESKILSLETTLKHVVDANLDERVKKTESNIIELHDSKNKISSKLSNLEDDSCWYKDQSEKMTVDFAKILDNQTLFQNELSHVKETILPHHTLDINKLFDCKVDKDEFNEVWTGAMLHSNNKNKHHGDVDVDFMIRDLDRKYNILNVEYKESVDGLKNKMDKKIEFLHKWILKHLSQIQSNNGDAAGDYTDIGKVRCLVCNHTIQKVDPETPFVKPEFKNSLGVLHDSRGRNTYEMDDMALPRTRFKIRVRDTRIIPHADDTNPLYKLDASSPLRDASPPHGKGANTNGLRPLSHEFDDAVGDDAEAGGRIEGTTKESNTVIRVDDPNGTTSEFYQEMERRYHHRPKSAPYRKTTRK